MILLVGCGPTVVVDDIAADCSPGACRVVFFVETRQSQLEDIAYEVSVLSQRRGTSSMFEAGSTRVRVRPREGERVRVETTVGTGVQTGNKAVVRRLR